MNIMCMCVCSLYMFKFKMRNIINIRLIHRPKISLFVRARAQTHAHTLSMSPDGLESVSVSHDVAQTKGERNNTQKIQIKPFNSQHWEQQIDRQIGIYFGFRNEKKKTSFYRIHIN